jgi:hypothetical protein
MFYSKMIYKCKDHHFKMDTKKKPSNIGRLLRLKLYIF